MILHNLTKSLIILSHLSEFSQTNRTYMLPPPPNKKKSQRCHMPGYEEAGTQISMHFPKLSINTDQLLKFFTWSLCDKTRGHDYKFYVFGACCDTRKYLFAVRVVQPWNTLPPDTDFSYLCRFKNCIKKLNLAQHCITVSQ